MREYLNGRSDPGATGLSVSHARTRPKSHGQALSANAAWRIEQAATVSLGLAHIRRHNFHHWRVTQGLRQGVALDQVQHFLNYRSIRTTRLRAKTAERDVDEAGARTSPFTEYTVLRPAERVIGLNGHSPYN
jgi:site-specific recombinase XerD